MQDIHRSTNRYEAWLRRQLGRQLVGQDLVAKHKKMRESPFAFLRATYWRWAELVLETCPEAARAPQVLAVGDIHLENFGTWRDADGRLVWGVNDFDEAAVMPYPMDLIRLAASAMLAGKKAPANAVCTAILRGYGNGLATPRSIVLDRDQEWLRGRVTVSDKKRARFWEKLEEGKNARAPAPFRAALTAAMPEPHLAIRTARRTAGAGSLGRPRWIGIADWRGAPVVREAKAMLPSSWQMARGERKSKIRSGEVATGRYRAADPWLCFAGAIVVRRLSPNNRKIEADDDPAILLSGEMLELMGFDLASVHLGVANRSAAIRRDLTRRKAGWLATLAERMATTVEADFAAWKTRQTAGDK